MRHAMSPPVHTTGVTRSVPTYVNGASDGLNATSHNINTPTNTIDGDLMLAFLAADNGPFTVTAPSGWTKLMTDTSGPWMNVWGHIAKAEGATSSWSITAACRMSMHSFRGAACVSYAAPARQSGTGSRPTAPVFKDTNNSLLVLMSRSAVNASNYTIPSGFTAGISASNTVADNTTSQTGVYLSTSYGAAVPAERGWNPALSYSINQVTDQNLLLVLRPL